MKKKLKNKIILTLIIPIIAGAIFLSGCGTSGETNNEAAGSVPDTAAEAGMGQEEDAKTPDTQAAEKVILTIWEGEFQKEEVLKEYIKVFNAKYPHIQIEYDIKSSDQYISLLNTALQSGEAPDLFWTHGTKTDNLPNLVKEGYVYDMSGDLDFSEYEEAGSIAPSVCFVDGKIYCTPAASIDTRVTYYNEDIFRERGYEIPATLEDFEALCDRIIADGMVPLSLGGASQWANLFMLDPIIAAVSPEWMEKACRGEGRLDDPEIKKAYGTFVDWVKRGYFGSDFLSSSEDAQFLAFATGKAVMTTTGTWNCTTIRSLNPDLKLGVFKIGTSEGVHHMVATPNSGYSVYSGSPHLEEAVLFCQFLTSLEGQQIFIDKFGAVPELPQLTSEDPVYKEMGKIDGKVFGSWYDNILNRPAKEGQDLRKLWEETCTDLLAGVEPLEAFLEELESMVQ